MLSQSAHRNLEWWSLSATLSGADLTYLQELYAEWVGVHAKVALLEGNAICIAHLQASPDVSSLQIVSRAQALHSG